MRKVIMFISRQVYALAWAILVTLLAFGIMFGQLPTFDFIVHHELSTYTLKPVEK